MDALAQRAPRRSMPVLSRLGVEPLQQGVNFPGDHRIGSCCCGSAVNIPRFPRRRSGIKWISCLRFGALKRRGGYSVRDDHARDRVRGPTAHRAQVDHPARVAHPRQKSRPRG